MKTKRGYNSTDDLNVLIRFVKLKNLTVYRFSKFCVEFRSKSDNFRFSYDIHKDRTTLEHWNVILYGKHEMRRLFLLNRTCDFLFLSKGYDHQAYK